VIDVGFLVPFAAGNFLYIGASDLVPELNEHHSALVSVVHFFAFSSGLALLWALRGALEA
jgi:zinc and cadmium transporter